MQVGIEHPIPLELLRGLAKHGGIKLGRITQTDNRNGIMVYRINIVEVVTNDTGRNWTPVEVQDRLKATYPPHSFKVNYVTYSRAYWAFELWSYNEPRIEEDRHA